MPHSLERVGGAAKELPKCESISQYAGRNTQPGAHTCRAGDAVHPMPRLRVPPPLQPAPPTLPRPHPHAIASTTPRRRPTPSGTTGQASQARTSSSRALLSALPSSAASSWAASTATCRLESDSPCCAAVHSADTAASAASTSCRWLRRSCVGCVFPCFVEVGELQEGGGREGTRRTCAIGHEAWVMGHRCSWGGRGQAGKKMPVRLRAPLPAWPVSALGGQARGCRGGSRSVLNRARTAWPEWPAWLDRPRSACCAVLCGHAP